jgi:predicted negative regulator of RcsB-dependent stress response
VDVYTTEDEQVEALKKWWKENARSILVGLVLGLAAVYGWRVWVSYQHNQAELASAQYAQVLQAVEKGDLQPAREFGARVIRDFGSTPYAFLSALALARLEVEKGSLDKARGHLEWALEHTPEDAFKPLVRLRLARVLLAQGQAAQALALAKTPDTGAFESQFREVEGDIYLVQGKDGSARVAYELALKNAGPEERDRLQMKLDDLGGRGGP